MFQVIQSDLFGMVKTWPFQDLQRLGMKRSRLESPGWGKFAFSHPFFFLRKTWSRKTKRHGKNFPVSVDPLESGCFPWRLHPGWTIYKYSTWWVLKIASPLRWWWMLVFTVNFEGCKSSLGSIHLSIYSFSVGELEYYWICTNGGLMIY